MNTFTRFTSKNLTVALVIATAAMIAQPAFAADFSHLTIKSSTVINKDCMVSDGYDPVWGCFINHFVPQAGQAALVSKPTIYLRADLPSALLPYVFFQNVGQFLAMPYSDQELAAVFNPAKDQFGSQDVRKAAANSFAYLALGGTLTPQKLNFFREALMR
jgi:hypothetical protein